MTVTVGLLAVVACLAGAMAVATCAALAALFVRRARLGRLAPAVIGVLGIAIVATVVGAKLMTVARYGADIPFWDEWEGALILAGFQDHTLTWRGLLSPHAEHQVFLGRVLTLLLQITDRQWDSRLQMVANGFLHAGGALAIVAATVRSARRTELFAIGALSTALAAIPFAGENAVWAHQSVFYLHVLFSIAGIGLATDRPPLSAGWILGLACASLSMLTLGSGAFAPAAIALVALLQFGRRPHPRALAAAACAGGLATAAALSVPRPPAHAFLAAHTVRDFVVAAARVAAWPAVDAPWLAIFFWLPALALAFVHLRNRTADPLDGNQAVLASLGGWVLLHDLAIALARGTGGGPLSPGYADILSVGVVVNTAAALTLVRRFRRPSIAWVFFALWFAVLLLSGFRASRSIDRDLSGSRELKRHQIENVRLFLASGDVAELRGKPYLHVPFPVAEPLADILRMPVVRDFLPCSLRAPVTLVTQEPGPFVAALKASPTDPITWSSEAKRAGGTLRSRPVVASQRPYLLFAARGAPAGDGRFLGSEDPSGVRHEVVRMALDSGGWRTWGVSRPAPGGTIIAVDERSGSGLEFRDPVEMGRLTFWSERLLRHGPGILAAGLAIAGLAFLLAMRADRRDRSTGR